MNSHRDRFLKYITILICTEALVLWTTNSSFVQNNQRNIRNWDINKKSERAVNRGKSGLRNDAGTDRKLCGSSSVAWAGPISRTGNKSGPIIIVIDGLAFEEVGPEGFEPFRGIEREDAGYLGKALRAADCINRIDAEINIYEWETTSQRDPHNTPGEVERLMKTILEKYEDAKNHHKPLVIIGHSWGSVLAYLALTNLAKQARQNESKEVEVALFITMGSPLGYIQSKHPNVIKDYLAWHKIPWRLKKPNNVKRWVNMWAKGDHISSKITVADNNPQIDENSEPTLREISLHPIKTTDIWHRKYYESDKVEDYICPELATKITTALVIDRSGSMRGDKLSRAKQAARAYVLAINPNDLVSLSVFSDSAATKITMAPRDALIGRIDSSLSEISATNFTNIGAGLEQAYRQIEQIASSQFSQKNALLLSDGRNNRGHWRPVVEKFIAHHWPIHTVGFGNDADHKTLRQIAKLTRGNHSFADISDIINVYQEISARAQNKSILLSFREALAPRSRLSYKVPVSEGAQALNIYTSWQGSRLGTKLNSPSGKTITPGNLYQTKGRYAQGQLFQMVEINQPQPGSWRLNLSWDVPPSTTEQVNVSVSEKSDIFTNSLGFRSQYDRREPVLINIQATEVVGEQPIPLQDASVTLQIQKPSSALTRMIQSERIDWSSLLKQLRGNPRHLTLFDDGEHDEYHPGDGIFGNTFRETDENGAYLVTATIRGRKQNGKKIEKKLQSSFQVGPIEENKITLSQVLRFMDQVSRQLPQVIEDPEKAFDSLLNKGKRRIDRLKRDPFKETEHFLKDLFGQ